MLLLLLMVVAVGEWLTRERSTTWDETLWVTIYPINADGSEASREYIQNLERLDFEDVEQFMQEEAESFGIALERPVLINLADEVTSYPPKPPTNGKMFAVMLWSLKMRYWAFQHDNDPGPKDIKIFVLYHDPETNRKLAHSIGLQKGMLGVVNAFSTGKMRGENNFVIAHEMLHTLGATDKYDLRTGLPIYPQGYADAALEPLYPQSLAEIMGGAVPLSELKAEMPENLKDTIVGELTAREIRWIQE